MNRNWCKCKPFECEPGDMNTHHHLLSSQFFKFLLHVSFLYSFYLSLSLPRYPTCTMRFLFTVHSFQCATYIYMRMLCKCVMIACARTIDTIIRDRLVRTLLIILIAYSAIQTENYSWMKSFFFLLQLLFCKWLREWERFEYVCEYARRKSN